MTETDVKNVEISEVKALTIHQALTSRPWQIAFAVSIIALFAIYWQTFNWWWVKWMQDESYYSHAPLIPLMSAFVVYLNRKTIGKLTLSPSLWGLGILVPAIAIHLLASLGNTASTMGLTFPFVVFGAIVLLFGKSVSREMLFPAGFLFFMCVLPGFILTKLSFKIQMLSTDTAVRLLSLYYNVGQEGTRISLPNIEVVVGAPCSGFRMLISLVAFAIFFAYMKEGPMWGRLTLVAMTVPLSLISNSVRIALIALWGQFFGEEAMHTFHDYSGFIVLAVAFVVLWWLAKVVKCEKFKSMLIS